MESTEFLHMSKTLSEGKLLIKKSTNIGKSHEEHRDDFLTPSIFT